MWGLGLVRWGNGINASPKLKEPARFDPAVQLPPHMVGATLSRHEQRRGKHRVVSGND